MGKHKVHIQWLKPEEGGRSSPPQGPKYSTLARFEMLSERWPHEAWSIILSISVPANTNGEMIAGIQMLNVHEAPKELLAPGSKFDLFEGRRCVARGEIF